MEEREHQTRDGCSGGKLRNTPHSIVCWIFKDRDGRRDLRRDLRYRTHLMSEVGAGTAKPFYVAIHISKWDVFTYIRGGSYTYCQLHALVLATVCPPKPVLHSRSHAMHEHVSTDCKRRVRLQLLETQGRTFQTSENHHNMITSRSRSHPGQNM